MFVGVTVFAGLIAVLASMQSGGRVTPHHSDYRRQVLSALSDHLQLSRRQKQHVDAFARASASRIGHSDETRLWWIVLPRHLQEEMLHLQRHAHVAREGSLFAGAAVQFRRRIERALRPAFVARGISLFDIREENTSDEEAACPPDGMYFLMSGAAKAYSQEVSTHTGTKKDDIQSEHFISLVAGDTVAEFALFDYAREKAKESPRMALSTESPPPSPPLSHVVCVENTELLLLRRDDFEELTENLIELRHTLQKIAAGISKKTKSAFCSPDSAVMTGDTSSDKMKRMMITATRGWQAADSADARAKCNIVDHVNAVVETSAPVLLAWFLYALPFQSSFLIGWQVPTLLVVLDTIASILLTVDTTQAHRRSHALWNQHASSSTSGISRYRNHPAKIFVAVDMLALCPWELLVYGALVLRANGRSTVTMSLQLYSVCRMPKLLLLHWWPTRHAPQLSRTARLWNESTAQDLCQRCRLSCRREHRVANNNSRVSASFNSHNNSTHEKLSTLVGLAILFATFSHVLACGWFTLGSSALATTTWAEQYSVGVDGDGFGNGTPLFTKNNTSPSKVEAASSAAVLLWYTTSAYYIFIALTTVGYGDIVPASDGEYLYASFVILLGKCTPFPDLNPCCCDITARSDTR